MKTRRITTTVHRTYKSKYRAAWKAIFASLQEDGPGELRSIEGTETWQRDTLKRWSLGVRDYGRRRPVDGFRLSIRICAENGLCFVWQPAK